jgi:MYXO-CTERM domain-containing protein
MSRKITTLGRGAALSLILGFAAGISAAQADVLSFDLTAGNSAISGFTGPYASVTVDLTSSTTATINFASLSNNGNIYLLGDGGTAGVNVNASTWTLSNITGTNAGTGFTPGPWSDGGAGNEDGWGSFNQTINSFDGYTHSSDTLSFQLTDTSGTWASAANVLAPNASGFEAAAHIFVTTSPANGANGALATGFAAGVSSVPEPSTWAMALMGFAGLGYAAFRRNRRESVSALA